MSKGSALVPWVGAVEVWRNKQIGLILAIYRLTYRKQRGPWLNNCEIRVISSIDGTSNNMVAYLFRIARYSLVSKTQPLWCHHMIYIISKRIYILICPVFSHKADCSVHLSSTWRGVFKQLCHYLPFGFVRIDPGNCICFVRGMSWII